MEEQKRPWKEPHGKSEPGNTYPKNPKKHPKKVLAVLFDLDGVLVDSVHIWHEIFNTVRCKHGLSPIGMNEFLEHVWGVPEEIVQPRYFPGMDVTKLLMDYAFQFKDSVAGIAPMEGITSVLDALAARNVKMAVTTNSYKAVVELLLKSTMLLPYFRAVITADMVSRAKPDPEMLLLAVKQLGTRKEHCVFIGDTGNDVQAGRAAGIFTVGLGIDADVRIEKLDEILSLEGISC